MDTKVVEVNKTIIVTTLLDGKTSGSFTSYINVEFIPDVVIVKNIICGPITEGADGGPSILSSDLADSKQLGIFMNSEAVYVNTMFILKKKVAGTYTFNWNTVDPNSNLNECSLAIQLDFVKYKEVKEGKVY
jgi:hypothetical protein